MKITFKQSLKPALLMCSLTGFIHPPTTTTSLLQGNTPKVAMTVPCHHLSCHLIQPQNLLKDRLVDPMRVWEEWKKEKQGEENKQREEREVRGGVMKRKEKVGNGQTSKPLPPSPTNGAYP